MGGGECRKCGCQQFKWNPVSAAEKLWDDVKGNNRKDRAFRNCLCGHHYNCHK
jgi:hypothetical protein